MFLFTWFFALAVSLLGLFHYAEIAASPVDGPKDVSRPAHMSNYDITKRQDPGPESAADPSGIEPEDEDPAQIAADGTDALRRGKHQ